MIASLIGPPVVGADLLEYLRRRLGVSDLRYAHDPSPINDGWETYIYRFQLGPAGGLAAELTRPLILRLYASPFGLPRLRHEFDAQQRVGDLGYPVPRPILLEERSDRFGAPFMIMEMLPGRTLLDLMLHQPWRIVTGPVRMAEMHARLHRLPAGDFPSPPGPFLDRHLDLMRAIMDKHGLTGMKPGLDWLHRHRPEPPRTPSIVHLDFHPVNLLFHDGRCTGLLDWSESDVGDRHADVATTIVLIKSAPVEVASALQRLSMWPGRFFLRRWYWRAYRRRLPLDARTLNYYVAWASFRRLCAWGRWLCAGPRVTGSKPSSMRYLSSDRVDILRQCFRRRAGVAVRL